MAPIWAYVLAMMVAGLSAAPSRAQVGPRALSALLTTPRFLRAQDTGVALVAGTGYGLREPLGSGAVHHSLLGSVALGLDTASGFGVELRVDGRAEPHSAREAPGDHETSYVGAPRALFRYAHTANERVSVGAELGVWVPGGKAPSLQVKATTLDALVGIDARLTGSWSLTAAGGFRFDQSGKALGNSDALSRSDWLVLGLSDSHALLGRVGVELTLPRSRLFAEGSIDALLGDKAPALHASPMHVAVGARTGLGAGLTLLTMARVLASARPSVDVAGPLVPFPPRAELWTGLSYQPGGTRPPQKPPEAKAQLIDEPKVEPPREVAEPPAEAEAVVMPPAPVVETAPVPPSGQVRLLVRDSQRGTPLEANVSITTLSTPDEPARKEKLGPDGRLELTLAPGRYQLEVTLYGWRKQKKTVEVEDQSVTILDVALSARSPSRARER